MMSPSRYESLGANLHVQDLHTSRSSPGRVRAALSGSAGGSGAAPGQLPRLGHAGVSLRLAALPLEPVSLRHEPVCLADVSMRLRQVPPAIGERQAKQRIRHCVLALARIYPRQVRHVDAIDSAAGAEESLSNLERSPARRDGLIVAPQLHQGIRPPPERAGVGGVIRAKRSLEYLHRFACCSLSVGESAGAEVELPHRTQVFADFRVLRSEYAPYDLEPGARELVGFSVPFRQGEEIGEVAHRPGRPRMFLAKHLTCSGQR